MTAGVPDRGTDLTQAGATPCECGVGSWVDTVKGYFTGAEALTKVARAGRVRRQLWRLALDGPVAVGASVRAATREGGEAGPAAGVVTSVAQNAGDAWVGLAFVSTSRAGGDLAPGLAVTVDGVRARPVGPGGGGRVVRLLPACRRRGPRRPPTRQRDGRRGWPPCRPSWRRGRRWEGSERVRARVLWVI